MKKLYSQIGLFVVLGSILFFHMTYAFAIHTDYAQKHLSAKAGVTLSLNETEGIASVSQSGFIRYEDGIGHYVPESEARIGATLQTGYRFAGWYQNGNKISDALALNFSVTGYTELTAKAELEVYHLSFYANGGQLPENINYTYTIESENLTLPVPTRDGYIFEGWYTTDNFLQSPVTNIKPGTVGNLTFYAKWKENIQERTYALILDNISNTEDRYPLIFIQSKEDYLDGSYYTGTTYGKLKVLSSYTDFVQTDFDATEGSVSAKAAKLPWSSYAKKISSVHVENTISPVSIAYWFYGFENCGSFHLEHIEGKLLKNMSHAFFRAGYQKETISFFGFDIWDVSNVTNMSSMFAYCGYRNINFVLPGIGNWDVGNVTDMSSMFAYCGRGCETWEIDDLAKWATTNVLTMRNMFFEAGRQSNSFVLSGLGTWDTSNVRDMYGMFDDAFYYAKNFDLGNLGEWNVSAVQDMGYMFADAGNRSKTWNIGDLSKWRPSVVENMEYMFMQAARSAAVFDIGDIGKWDVSKVKNMGRLFYFAGYSATTYFIGDLSDWNVSSVNDMQGAFYCSGFNSKEWSIGNLGNWDVSHVIDASFMFARVGRLEPNWSIGDLKDWDVSNVTNMKSMFDSAGYSSKAFSLKGLEYWDTKNVTNMDYMFYSTGYAADWTLDCRLWNVAKVMDHNYFNTDVENKVIAPAWKN